MGDGGMFAPMMLVMVVPLVLIFVGLALAIVAISRSGQSGRGTGQIRRPAHDRVLAGVAGGIAEHFAISPALVRVLWALALLVPVTTLLALGLYLVLALALPSAPIEA